MLIRDAIKYFGSKAKLAEALGVNRSAISNWKGDLVPRWRAYELERITQGELRLDPTLYQKPATAA
jgi:DNA-binding transcriptional regulator YdaS (Cro superfamily)